MTRLLPLLFLVSVVACRDTRHWHEQEAKRYSDSCSEYYYRFHFGRTAEERSRAAAVYNDYYKAEVEEYKRVGYSAQDILRVTESIHHLTIKPR